jgi:hypothetical protein
MKSFTIIFLGLFALCEVEAFVLDRSNRNARLPISSLAASMSDNGPNENARRQALDRLVTFTGAAAASVLLTPSYASALTTDAATSAATEKEGAMYSPKFVQTYDDFKESPEGWSYREVKAGQGNAATKGDRVVYDWVSYYVATILAGSFASASETLRTNYFVRFLVNAHFVFRRVGIQLATSEGPFRQREDRREEPLIRILILKELFSGLVILSRVWNAP